MDYKLGLQKISEVFGVIGKIKLLSAYPQIKIQEWGFFTTGKKFPVKHFF
jgi:hypothetical protein